MTGLSVDEAQAAFDELLQRGERVERVVITRDGIAIAELIPVTTESQPTMTVQEAIEGLRELRKDQRLDGLSIRDLIEEGRR